MKEKKNFEAVAEGRFYEAALMPIGLFVAVVYAIASAL